MSFISLNRENCLSRKASFATCAAVIIALSTGCGGGSGGGAGNANNKIISGQNLGVAIGVADSKAAVAGIAVPFVVLALASPAPIVPDLARSSKTRGGLTAVAGLNLYSSSVVAGKTLTLSFFSDAAGQHKVGTITVVSTETIGSSYTYPVAFHATGSITGGSIPLSGDFTATFTDSKGANTLAGSLNLTSNNIALMFNLSLNDSGAVGSNGTITASLNYNFQGSQIPITTTLSGLSGGPTTSITGAAAITATVPILGNQTGSGTGTLDILDDTFTLDVTAGGLQGLLEAYDGGKDTLTVTPVGGGTPVVIANASTFNIASLLTATTTGGTGTSGYQAPLAIQGTGTVSVEATLGDGEMVGYSRDTTNATTGYYWASPTAAPEALDAPANGTHTSAHGIATYSGQTVIVGSYQDSSGVTQPCFWILTNGAFKPYAASSTLPNGGVFQSISPNGNTIVGYSFTSAEEQQPIAYFSGTFYNLPITSQVNVRAIAVDNNNDILGTGYGSAPVPGVWPHVAVTNGAITTAFQPLAEPSGIGETPEAFHMSDNGVIVGTDGFNALYWKSSDNFAPHVLQLGDNAGVNAYGVNHAGTQATGSLFATSPATTYDIAYWSSLTASPTDVSTKLGSLQGSYTSPAGFFLLDDGSIIAMATVPPSTVSHYIYIQKK